MALNYRVARPRWADHARRRQAARLVCLLQLTCLAAWPARAQQRELSLSDARARARQASPSVAAAQAGVDAASGRARQAGAYPNPVLLYSREQTSANSQDIAAFEQRLELGGQRGARVAAAGFRHAAAEARLALAQAELDAEVARRFAAARAAQRREELATATAEQFSRALTAVQERLAAGDASGYESRRVQLEAARYAAIAAEASLAARQAGLRLSELLGSDAVEPVRPAPLLTVESERLALPADSLAALVLANSHELRALAHDAEAAAADARLASRERLPTAALTAGYKREQADGASALSGFVAGIAFPLPIWDRRSGAVDAADAESRRVLAELAAARLRVLRDTRETVEAVRRADEQVGVLARVLGAEARAAIAAAEAAYAEGEIALVEWLDAVRAYFEAESAYATVQAAAFIQRASLERLLGVALLR